VRTVFGDSDVIAYVMPVGGSGARPRLDESSLIGYPSSAVDGHAFGVKTAQEQRFLPLEA